MMTHISLAVCNIIRQPSLHCKFFSCPPPTLTLTTVQYYLDEISHLNHSTLLYVYCTVGSLQMMTHLYLAVYNIICCHLLTVNFVAVPPTLTLATVLS